MNDPSEWRVTDPELLDEVQMVIRDESRKEAKIEVAKSLRGCHELVSTTNQELQAAQLKKYRERFSSFQEQADIALRFHCKEGNLKWVSLMLWAGADPMRP